jgi:curved DNA-binding protein CbpA
MAEGYTGRVPKRDPHDVLGVERDASAAQIKAAWRRLARQHHPDLTGGDAAAARTATRQMAEINAAYESLRTGSSDRLRGRRAPDEPATPGAPSRRRGGPPRPKPQRPVTGRVDTSQTFRPRNQTTSADAGFRPRVDGAPPRATVAGRDPLRASDPTGPLERGRLRHFRPPPRPPLADSRSHRIEFGKFRGHTLGEIADFEPSYIDWIASTISKDPELLAAARVVREDLDRRAVVRRPRGGAERRRQADQTA